MEPLTKFNAGKEAYLNRLHFIFPAEVQHHFCQCRDYYGITKTNGIYYCNACHKLNYYLHFNNDKDDRPYYAYVYHIKYCDLFPDVVTRIERIVECWIPELRECPLCESYYITPHLPYEPEFCPPCEAIQ